MLFVFPSLLAAEPKKPRSQIILKHEISLMTKRSNTPRTVKGIEVYSRKAKKVLFDFNSGFLFNPASNLKIVTTSFALQNLGIDYKFKTAFVVSGVRREKTIDGDLVAVTCGDPLITHDALDSIASVISKKGVGGINANIIVDVSRFDSLEWGSGWMWNDEPGDYQMFISPACLDHNTISVEVSLDSTGHRLDISTSPATGFVRVASSAIADTLDSLYVTREMFNDTNLISASGFYSTYLRPTNCTFSVRHPAEYFGMVFKEMLEKNGIRVLGKVITKSTNGKMNFESAKDTLFIFEHSIDTVISYINKVSDNLGAECLLREVPFEIYREVGSAANGTKLEEDFLKQCGVDSTEYYIVDGSGLSRYDLITPDAIVKVLNYDLDQPYKNLFFHSLPVSGVDGTLENRMDQDFVTGNILAKTGSISGVSTLSGYVQLPRDTLVFSMMMQNFVTKGDSIHALQDSLCKILSLYNDNPNIFKKNLMSHNVGTYWAAYQRKEMDRIKKRRHTIDKYHKNPSTNR